MCRWLQSLLSMKSTAMAIRPSPPAMAMTPKRGISSSIEPMSELYLSHYTHWCSVAVSLVSIIDSFDLICIFG